VTTLRVLPDGRILSVPLAGGTPKVLADNLLLPDSLVLVGKTLFWTTSGPSGPGSRNAVPAGVWSMPVSGGVPVSVESRATTGGLAVDTTHVAWLDFINPTFADWTVVVSSR
jgi:hypothetical protein